MKYCLLVLSLCWLLAAPAGADERILDYQSRIMLHANGELSVTEKITVRAEGQNIQRGIYRDFPTRYKDHLGNHYQVEFDIDQVFRDGYADAWHTKERSNGIRLYIGDADFRLPAGVYSYEIQFRTNRQLGFFDDHDELWWNAVGTGWDFPVDQASATVSLPFEVPVADLTLNAFVGAYGSRETSVLMGVIDARTVEFETTRPLAPREGFSIVVGWPKGLMAEPSAWQKIRWFAKDNGAAIVLLAGFLFGLAWYYRSWRKVGRDPDKGVIIPRFQPPEALSPAASRYVLDMSFDRNAFTAAIISLAVKGHIEIEEEDKEFTLRRSGKGSGELTAGESGVLEALLPYTPSSITMDDKNYRRFQSARSALKQALKEEHLGRLFQLNTLYLAPPIVITVLTAILALAFRGGPAIWIPWLLITVVMHALFIWLMRAPTPSGRKVMDEIEGFKMYLGTAEQDRLDRMKSPELTPEVFESFLPYAYALGVENNWCERFAREMPQELQQRSAYNPAWYHGNYRGMSALNHLGDNFSSSFSSAISSASSPPGSSSGGGGGGFSGGGGGGGGGGGW